MSHFKFDDVKELYFDCLNKCIDAFLTLRCADADSGRAAEALDDCVREIYA